MVLVDSDVLIEVLRGRNTAIIQEWSDLSSSTTPVLYSPVSEAEIWAGARADEHEAIAMLFETLECPAIDRETARLAGEYLRRYHKSHAVELGDALIAATAKLRGAALWTRNRKHYPMAGVSFRR